MLDVSDAGGGRWCYRVSDGYTRATFTLRAEHVHSATIDALSRAAIDAVKLRKAKL